MNTSNFNSSRPKRPRNFFSDENDDTFEAQLEAMKAENAKLKKELDVKNTAIANLYVANSQLQSNQSNKAGTNEDKEAEIDRLKEVEAKLQTELNEAQTKLENERLKYEDEIHKLKSLMEDQKEESRQKIAFRDNRILELEEQLSALVDVKVDLRTKNDEAENQFENERKENEAKINTLKANIHNLTKQNVELETRSEKAEVEHEKEIQAWKNEQEKLQTEYEKKNKELEDKLKALRDERDGFKQKEDAANTVVEDQQRKIEELENQLQQTSKRYVSLEDIHNGPEIFYDLLDYRTVVNIKKLEAGDLTIWKLYSTETSEPFEIDVAEVFRRTRFELNLTGKFVCKDEKYANRIKEIIPRLTCTITSLSLYHQHLDEYEFLKLVSTSAKKVYLNEVSIANMTIDEILTKLPNIETFKYLFKNNGGTKNDMTESVYKNFLKLPKLEKLTKFKLYNCANTFDLESFAGFIKNHPNVDFAIKYNQCDVTTKAIIRSKKQKLNLCIPYKLEILFED